MDYHSLLALIDACKKKAGRTDDIQLIAVSKKQSPEKILSTYAQGCKLFGESRVQEWETKKNSLPQDIDWHFIGPLQKNKVRKLIGKVALIHSVDSIELAKKMNEISSEINVNTKILLEVNTSGEESKHGFFEDEVFEAFETISKMPSLTIEGLMTIGPNTEDQAKIRASFRQLRRIKESLPPLKHLSMGMSHDFEIAIEEGATLLRVGSLIFE